MKLLFVLVLGLMSSCAPLTVPTQVTYFNVTPTRDGFALVKVGNILTGEQKLWVYRDKNNNVTMAPADTYPDAGFAAISAAGSALAAPVLAPIAAVVVP